MEQPGPPVAGMRASAGGLDAFKKFFRAMPADSGIAFVLIPHLDPRHESLMVELMGRHTTMPVVEAADGMAVEANHFYIIPPNKHIAISDGILRLTGPVERVEELQSLNEELGTLHAILNTAVDAIITIDEQGMIQSVNPAAERMFGYMDGEMVGHNVSKLMPSPYREQHDQYLRRYLETGEARIIGIGREVAGRRKDGSTFPADLSVSRVHHMKLFTGIIRDITRYKELERDVVEIASMQQRRIGQDLHDRVGQELTALNMLVSDLAETVHTDLEQAVQVIERIAQGLRRSQQELRNALRGLVHSSIDSDGLATALGELVHRTQAEGKLVCTCDCPESVTVADSQTATHLYLIAQEAIHNTVKHARARNVWITLQGADGALGLTVKDDGVGIPKSPTETQGLGLRIMQNRAAIIGAKLSIARTKPNGTLVTCTLSGTNDAQKKDKKTSSHPDR